MKLFIFIFIFIDLINLSYGSRCLMANTYGGMKCNTYQVDNTSIYDYKALPYEDLDNDPISLFDANNHVINSNDNSSKYNYKALPYEDLENDTIALFNLTEQAIHDNSRVSEYGIGEEDELLDPNNGEPRYGTETYDNHVGNVFNKKENRTIPSISDTHCWNNQWMKQLDLNHVRQYTQNMSALHFPSSNTIILLLILIIFIANIYSGSILLIFMISLLLCVNAQLLNQQKILAPVPGSSFGSECATSGQWAIITAVNDDSSAIDAGSAYIYRLNKTDASWTETQKITPNETLYTGTRFGSQISMSGQFAVICAPMDLGYTGSCWVWKYDNSTAIWSETQKLRASDPYDSDLFGQAVDIEGDTIFIGAASKDEPLYNAGVVYVFKYENGLWIEKQKLGASDVNHTNFQFGRSVSISGHFAVIGTYHSHNARGTCYVFKYDNNTGIWNETQILVGSDVVAGDGFCHRAVIYGNNIIANAWNGKAVYTYHYHNGLWTEMQKLQIWGTRLSI
eukprot:323780_1